MNCSHEAPTSSCFCLGSPAQYTVSEAVGWRGRGVCTSLPPEDELPGLSRVGLDWLKLPREVCGCPRGRSPRAYGTGSRLERGAFAGLCLGSQDCMDLALGRALNTMTVSW